MYLVFPLKNAGYRHASLRSKRERNIGVGVVKLIIMITMITTIILIMLIMIIVRILIIMIINSDNIDVKTVIITTTMITVTIVITCFIQNGACSCQKTWETPRKTRTLIGSLCALIFTLPDYISHLHTTVASFITDIKGLGGFPLFGRRPFTASYLPKPPG